MARPMPLAAPVMTATLSRRVSMAGNSLSIMRSIWKWVGMAGVAGVVAGGAVVARDQRKRRAYTPDEIRSRLQQRLTESDAKSFQGKSGSASV
jgi:hypothetical protein